jgi:hypothetical protein
MTTGNPPFEGLSDDEIESWFSKNFLKLRYLKELATSLEIADEAIIDNRMVVADLKGVHLLSHGRHMLGQLKAAE